MQSNKNNFIIYSIVPDIKNGEGHMLPYQKLFIEALALISVDYRVNYYSKTKIFKYKNWSNNIQIGLITAYKANNFSLRFFSDFIKLTLTIKTALSVKEKLPYKKKFAFIESFGIIELLAFTFAIIFLKNINPIILFRHYPKSILKKFLFKLSVFLFVIFKKKPILISDSNKLALDLGLILNKSVITMPIPLNIVCIKKKSLGVRKKTIGIWWPGPPRTDKGLDEVVNFCNHLNATDNIKFYLSSDTSGLEEQQYIKLLPSRLSNSDYYNLFNIVDVIFLPYSQIQYSHSTSNIFIEAILHEKITLVSSGTWMSDELIRFDLKNLVINNHSIYDLKKKVKIEISRKSNYKKLRSMKLFYLKFHSMHSFSKRIEKILIA